MKHFKILITLFVIFFSTKHSQAQYPVPGSYLTNNTMTPFHGTWLWTSSIDTLKLYLNTQRVNDSNSYDTDNLLGWYIYKRGNVIIANTYPYIGNYNESVFLGGNDRPYALNIAKCYFKDIYKNKECQVILALNSLTNQITWKLTQMEGLNLRTNPNSPPTLIGYTLPTNIVLTKQ